MGARQGACRGCLGQPSADFVCSWTLAETSYPLLNIASAAARSAVAASCESPCGFGAPLPRRGCLETFHIIPKQRLTCSFCLAIIVKPFSSISCMISCALPARTASGLINAKVFSSSAMVTSQQLRRLESKDRNSAGPNSDRSLYVLLSNVLIDDVKLDRICVR